MTTSTALVSAIVSAVVSIVIVVVAQVWEGRRAKGGRTYDRRREALTGAQDAALAVRNAMADYGPLVRTSSGIVTDELTAAAQRVDDTFAQLEVAMTRLEHSEVYSAVETWLRLVRYRYISTEEVTAGEENAAWNAMNDRFGVALRSDSAQVSDALPPGTPG